MKTKEERYVYIVCRNFIPVKVFSKKEDVYKYLNDLGLLEIRSSGKFRNISTDSSYRTDTFTIQKALVN